MVTAGSLSGGLQVKLYDSRFFVRAAGDMHLEVAAGAVKGRMRCQEYQQATVRLYPLHFFKWHIRTIEDIPIVRAVVQRRFPIRAQSYEFKREHFTLTWRAYDEHSEVCSPRMNSERFGNMPFDRGTTADENVNITRPIMLLASDQIPEVRGQRRFSGQIGA